MISRTVAVQLDGQSHEMVERLSKNFASSKSETIRRAVRLLGKLENGDIGLYDKKTNQEILFLLG